MIAIVYGGDSLESEISILSALKIKKELDKYDYPNVLVFLDKKGQFYIGSGLNFLINYQHLYDFKDVRFVKEKGKTYLKTKFTKTEVELVYLLCHGYHAEDGTLGGYFETLKIPVIYPGLIQSSILQDKQIFKYIMKSMYVNVPKGIFIKEELFKKEIQVKPLIENLKFPLIVKPSHLGSSIGVKKVKKENELNAALYEVFRFDSVALVEECIGNLKEINIALFRHKDKIITSLLERVNNKDEILSFNDKYDNYSLNDAHIIPADIDNDLKRKIEEQAKKIYQTLDLSSVVRFDYLYDEQTKKLYLNEINAIPGSLAYYLFEKMDIKVIDLISMLKDNYYYQKELNKNKIHTYNEALLDHLKAK